MFDFPNSPTEGTIFSPTGGPVYVYTGGVWRMQGSGQVVTAEARNRVVNPSFQITQQVAKSTLTSTSASYVADQWVSGWVNAGAPGTLVEPDTASEASWYYRMWTGSTADASVAAGDHFIFSQAIEGGRIADFKWGTAQAKPAVLRFRARTGTTGTFCVALRNGGTTHNFVKNCAITAPNWTDFVIPIPAMTAGTWATDTGVGIWLSFAIMAGSTFTGGTDGAWAATGSHFATSAISNWMASTSKFFDIANVGLYLDPLATAAAPPFQMPDEAEELRACQRYFCFQYCDALVPSGTYCITPVYFPVRMRAAPAVTNWLAGTPANSPTVVGDFVSGPEAGYFQISGGANANVIHRLNAYNARM